MVLLTLNAQTIIMGDMNNDKKLDVSDVTALVDCIMKDKAQTLDITASPYADDNAALVGTWTKNTQESITFGADGTTDLAGAATYKYFPFQGHIVFYNATGRVCHHLDVLSFTPECFVVVDGNAYTYWWKGNAPQEEDDHSYVDLGLTSGTLWATCNVGAAEPTGCGDYLTWGYVQDDAAATIWGGDWRIPTPDDWQELCKNCTWTWCDESSSTFGGVAGYKVASKSNEENYIFLPAAGFYSSESIAVGNSGYYWSSMPDESDPDNACCLQFSPSGYEAGGTMPRNIGLPIRPVIHP